MIKKSKLAALLLCGTIMAACTQEVQLNIIPQPQQVEVAKGYFTLNDNVEIKGNAEFEVAYLKEKLSKAAGVQTNDNGKKTIEIHDH